MDKVLVFNPDKCTGCRVCEMVCSLQHTGACNPASSRIRIVRFEEQGVDVPMFCLQCEQPICADVCPIGAVGRNPVTGAVETDHTICIQCRMCVVACPFGGAAIDTLDGGKIIRCDLCGGDPACVKFCVTGGVEFVRQDELAMRKKREAAMKLERLSDRKG